MSATHTPGPWHSDDLRGFVVAPAGETVAIVCFPAACGMEQGDANGHLIAAAPELLRVARLALEELEWFPAIRHTQTLRDDLRRVIAAATSASDTPTEHQGA
jgi:hypothetical protein